MYYNIEIPKLLSEVICCLKKSKRMSQPIHITVCGSSGIRTNRPYKRDSNVNFR